MLRNPGQFLMMPPDVNHVLAFSKKLPPAPIPMIRPLIDLDALDLVPMRRPVEVQTSMEGARVTARRDDIPDYEPDLPAEPTPEPVPAMTAAAEAVTGRLSSLLADPGEEPEPQEADLFEP